MGDGVDGWVIPIRLLERMSTFLTADFLFSSNTFHLYKKEDYPAMKNDPLI